MRRQDMEKDRPARDGGDDPQGAFETARAALQVNGKHPLEQPCPTPVRRDRAAWSLDTLLAGGWGDGPSQLAVRGQTTRVPHLVHPRRGHQGRQFL